jgi:putative resolvase
MKRWVKLSEYAKLIGYRYITVWKKYKEGKITPTRKEGNRVLVMIDEDEMFPLSSKNNRVAIYARVSDNDSKDNLARQQERLENYATMRGYRIVKSIKEVGSGLDDSRTKLAKLLADPTEYDILLVEHKDRLTRFGFNYIETLLKSMNKRVEVANASDENSNLVEDMISIVYSFSARLYGSRRAKHIKDQTSKAINESDRA